MKVHNPVAKRKRLTTLLLPHVDEPILAIGFLSGAGEPMRSSFS